MSTTNSTRSNHRRTSHNGEVTAISLQDFTSYAISKSIELAPRSSTASFRGRKVSLVQEPEREEPDTKKETEAPKDRFAVAYLIYMLLGLCVLYPWNAMITSLDYLFLVYPNADVDRFFSIIYFPCNLTMLILCTIFQRALNNKLRIMVGFSCIFSAIMMPILGNYAVLHGSLQGNTLSLVLLYVGAALAGMGGGWAEGGIFADASPLPPVYIQSVSVGTGMAGLLVVVLRCITKASFGDAPSALQTGAMVFYFIAVGIVFMSLAFYLGLLHRLPIVRHYRSRVQYHDKGEHNSSAKQYWALFKVSWTYYLGLVILYTTTLFIFPSMLMSVPPPAALGSWYFILVSAVFNVGDVIGKAIPSGHRWLTITSKRWLLWLPIVRVLFIPIMVLLNKVDNGWICLAADLLLALTNGYLTTNIMVRAAAGLKPVEQEIVINSCVLSLVTGLAAGSFLSFIWLIPAMAP